MTLTTRISGTLAAAIFLLNLGALAGCGDGTGTPTTATTSGPGMTTGTTGPGETTMATTEGVTTSGTMGPTSTTTSTTTMTPVTSTGPDTTTTGVTETTGATTGTTGTTGMETSGTETTGTTGEPVGSTCEQDSDCELYTDCCSCDVQAKGETPPACGIMECLIDVCSTLDVGTEAPVCRFGRCTFAKISCNPLGVQCDVAPPVCPPGQLPSVTEACWSGQCAPIEACDWVPDCETCNTDTEDPLVCIFKGQKGAYHVCEPKPVGCGDVPEIDCACGAEICEGSPPHLKCIDQVPGIVCDCEFC